MNKKRAFFGLFLPLIAVLAISLYMLLGKSRPTKDLSGYSVATFAGGCFWCVEADFEKVFGVEEVISGYTGGELKDPSYEQVSSGATGHREAVQVYYDPDKVSYRELVQYFFRHVDPTDQGGSFVDRGEQYASAIYYANDEERQVAEEEKQKLADAKIFDSEIVTEIAQLGEFYIAEDYHQDYHDRASLRYKFYRNASGRDDFLQKTWDKGDQEVARYLQDTEKYDLQKLSDLEYEVTQEKGTEPAFDNKYWDNEREGIYVDIVSGQPLFSSRDKYESGTGWPSFSKPISEDAVLEREDDGLFMKRTEIISSKAGSHLGHVFTDGPEPTGLRYCMNSAAMDFVPVEELTERGYGKYLDRFE